MDPNLALNRTISESEKQIASALDKKTILIVDDEPSNVQILVDILENDYRVLVATNGEQALKLLNKDEPPNIVLLDVHMPGISGFDVLKEARSKAHLAALPIIMVTAHSEAREEAYALEQGATDFLSKPVSAARVKARVKHQLNLCQSSETIRIKNSALEEALQELQETKDGLTDFMAMVSHELRTPIAILQCETELLVDGVRQASPENLGSLLDETKHVSELINDMFDLVLSETNTLQYNMQTIDLASIVTHSSKLFTNKLAEKGLELAFESNDINMCQIKGDQKRIRQVIDNLLENSLKYTKSGAQVKLELQLEEKHAIVSITDGPPGIPQQDLEKIFDKFYRVEKSRNRAKGGSGLGLAICRSIIDAHQGNIKAFHAESGGLGIQFQIPKLS